MFNIGELKEQQEVEVEYRGRQTKAKVLGDSGKGMYKVSVWTSVTVAAEKYEEGFETRQPIHRTLPRSKIYAATKELQKLSAGRP